MPSSSSYEDMPALGPSAPPKTPHRPYRAVGLTLYLLKPEKRKGRSPLPSPRLLGLVAPKSSEVGRRERFKETSIFLLFFFLLLLFFKFQVPKDPWDTVVSQKKKKRLSFLIGFLKFELNTLPILQKRHVKPVKPTQA